MGFDPLNAPFPRKTNAGWVGSKLGTHGDLVTIDANGYIDQAVAVNTVVAATTRVGRLQIDIASTIAVATDEALAVTYQPFNPDSLAEYQLITGADLDTVVTATAAMVGDIYGLARTTLGAYVVDTNTTTHVRVVRVDTARNTVWVQHLATLALA